jgi:hypothetical protein
MGDLLDARAQPDDRGSRVRGVTCNVGSSRYASCCPRSKGHIQNNSFSGSQDKPGGHTAGILARSGNNDT